MNKNEQSQRNMEHICEMRVPGGEEKKGQKKYLKKSRLKIS